MAVERIESSGLFSKCDPELDPFAPWATPGYRHYHLAETPEIDNLRLNPPKSLTTLNPPDAVKEVWDFTLSVPANSWRKILAFGDRAGVRDVPRNGPNTPDDWSTNENGWRLYQLAHTLACRQVIEKKDDTPFDRILTMWAAKVWIADTLSLPVFEGWDAPEGFKGLGLAVLPGYGARNPSFYLSPESDLMTPYKWSGIIGVGVDWGTEPHRLSENRFNHATKWSGSPVKFCSAGVEYFDILSRMPVDGRTQSFRFIESDLMPLGHLLAYLFEFDESDGLTPLEFIETDEYKEMYNRTPFAPRFDGLRLSFENVKKPKAARDDWRVSHLWELWDATAKAAYDLIVKSANLADTDQYGAGAWKKPKATRLRNYNTDLKRSRKKVK